MSVIMKEAMRRNKRRVPVDHSPESRAQNYALVFNQKGEVFTPFREVNLAMPSDKCTKDTSHAFFCMTILRKEATMKIQIDYNGSVAKCLITEFHGHPDKFVNFNNADKYSQVYAMGAFQNIIKHWEREHQKKGGE